MRIVKRFEYKYLMSYKDYHMLQSKISPFLIKDRHDQKGRYPVNSIYFDDLCFHGAADKAFGNQQHQKYRIRYYRNPKLKRLECKEKTGSDSTKYSTEITEEIAGHLLEPNLDILHDNFNDPLIRRFTLDHMLKHLTPQFYVFYEREAYRDKTNNFRLTFDHNIQGSRYKDDLSLTQPVIRPNQLIMELKYEHHYPKHIKHILNQFKMTHLAVSKYFLVFDQFNY